MAKLTTKARAKLPAAEFALPGKRAYPVDTPARAANAKARAAQFATPAEKKVIDRKADAVLGKSGSTAMAKRKKRGAQ